MPQEELEFDFTLESDPKILWYFQAWAKFGWLFNHLFTKDVFKFEINYVHSVQAIVTLVCSRPITCARPIVLACRYSRQPNHKPSFLKLWPKLFLNFYLWKIEPTN